MSIRVSISPILHQYTNNEELTQVAGDTVGECLEDLVKQFPDSTKWLFNENGEVGSYFCIYINHDISKPRGLSEVVKDGDEISIVKAFGCCF